MVGWAWASNASATVDRTNFFQCSLFLLCGRCSLPALSRDRRPAPLVYCLTGVVLGSVGSASSYRVGTQEKQKSTRSVRNQNSRYLIRTSSTNTQSHRATVPSAYPGGGLFSGTWARWDTKTQQNSVWKNWTIGAWQTAFEKIVRNRHSTAKRSASLLCIFGQRMEHCGVFKDPALRQRFLQT